MPNSPRSIAGNIGVEFTADSSDVEREAKRAERAVDGVGNSLEEMGLISATAARSADRYNAAMQNLDDIAENLGQTVDASTRAWARWEKATLSSAVAADKAARSMDRVIEKGRQARQAQLLAVETDQQERALSQQVAFNNLAEKQAQIEAEREDRVRQAQRNKLALIGREIGLRERNRQFINRNLSDAKDIARTQDRIARSLERSGFHLRNNRGYLVRQLSALRDFFVRYATIIALFAAPAAATGLAGASITAGEDFIVRQRQLEALIGTYGDFAVAQQRIQSASDATRTSFQQTTDIFETLFLQFQDMPFAIERTAAVTEGINLLFRGSAASAEEMSRAIVQLRQGFAKGVFSAQDTRILTEQIRLFDDFLRAAGLPIGQRISADRLRIALAGGAGRALLEQRSGAIDTRISVNARRVADAFQRVSAIALEQSGFLDAVNFGLEYFEMLLLSPEFEQWLAIAYDRGTEFISALTESTPKILEFGEKLFETGLQITSVMAFVVKTLIDYAEYIGHVVVGLISLAVLQRVVSLVTSGPGGAIIGSILLGTSALTAVIFTEAIKQGAGELLQQFGLAPTIDSDSLLRELELFRTTQGLLSTQGELRYSAIDAEIRRRGLELGKEEEAVLDLTQAYRALGKQYKDVFNAEPILTFEERLDLAVEQIGINLEKLRGNLVDTFNELIGPDKNQLERTKGGRVTSSYLNLFDPDVDLSGLLDLDLSTSDGLAKARNFLRNRFNVLTDFADNLDEEGVRKIIERLIALREDYFKGVGYLKSAENARGLFEQSLIDLLEARDADPIPEVDRRQFSAIGQVLKNRSTALNGVLRQLDQRRLDREFEDAVTRFNQSNIRADVLAGPLARSRLDAQVAAQIRDLEARRRVAEINAIESGDESQVEAIQLQLDILNREADRTAELSKAIERQIDIDADYHSALADREDALVDLRDAEENYARALQNRNRIRLELAQIEEKIKNASGQDLVRYRDERDKIREKLKLQDQNVESLKEERKKIENQITELEYNRQIADEPRLAALKKRLDAINRHVDLLELLAQATAELVDADSKLSRATRKLIAGQLEDRRETGQPFQPFDLIGVFEQRALDQVLSYEQSRNSLIAQIGEINNRTQARLESTFFFRSELSRARLDVVAAQRAGASADEIATLLDRLTKLEDQMSNTTGKVNTYTEAWIRAREAQLDIEDILEGLNQRLSDIGRISETVIQSLRDGFISLLDSAESFRDVLHGIIVQLRNLALDLFIFEPLERGLRSVLTNNVVRNVIVPDELRQRAPLGKPAIGGDSASSSGSRVDVYQTNVVPPDVAVAYQRQFANFAVTQGQQLAENPYASGL